MDFVLNHLPFLRHHRCQKSFARLCSRCSKTGTEHILLFFYCRFGNAQFHIWKWLFHTARYYTNLTFINEEWFVSTWMWDMFKKISRVSKSVKYFSVWCSVYVYMCEVLFSRDVDISQKNNNQIQTIEKESNAICVSASQINIASMLWMSSANRLHNSQTTTNLAKQSSSILAKPFSTMREHLPFVRHIELTKALFLGFTISIELISFAVFSYMASNNNSI